MKQLEKDIRVSVETLNDVDYLFPSSYSKAFLNTNEQISSYYREFPICGQRVLTVAASGDHLLQAVHQGAKAVDVFDCNRLALYVVRLKVAAIKALNITDFENYFSINNGDVDFMHPRIYEKISDFLDFEGKCFWNSIYDNGDLSHISRLVFGPQRHDLGPDSYRNKENYYSIREMLDDVSIGYYYSDLFDLSGVLTGSYKSIFLSNIYDWLSFEKKAYFKYYVLFELSKHLEAGGKIAVYAPTLIKDMQYESYGADSSITQPKVYIYKK